jgi:transcriptional regulator with XRE-family HTH domain
MIRIAMKVNGEKIKFIRESRSLTKEAFAAKAKVSRQAIEAWERGNVGSFRTLAKIAELLEVPEKLLVEMD